MSKNCSIYACLNAGKRHLISRCTRYRYTSISLEIRSAAAKSDIYWKNPKFPEETVFRDVCLLNELKRIDTEAFLKFP